MNLFEVQDSLGSRLPGAFSGFRIARPSGDVVLENNVDQLFNMASIAKLCIARAALVALGPKASLETPVVTNTTVRMALTAMLGESDNNSALQIKDWLGRVRPTQLPADLIQAGAQEAIGEQENEMTIFIRDSTRGISNNTQNAGTLTGVARIFRQLIEGHLDRQIPPNSTKIVRAALKKPANPLIELTALLKANTRYRGGYDKGGWYGNYEADDLQLMREQQHAWQTDQAYLSLICCVGSFRFGRFWKTNTVIEGSYFIHIPSSNPADFATLAPEYSLFLTAFVETVSQIAGCSSDLNPQRLEELLDQEMKA